MADNNPSTPGVAVQQQTPAVLTKKQMQQCEMMKQVISSTLVTTTPSAMNQHANKKKSSPTNVTSFDETDDVTLGTSGASIEEELTFEKKNDI